MGIAWINKDAEMGRKKMPSSRIDLDLEELEIAFKEISSSLHSTTSNLGTGFAELVESK